MTEEQLRNGLSISRKIEVFKGCIEQSGPRIIAFEVKAIFTDSVIDELLEFQSFMEAEFLKFATKKLDELEQQLAAL